MEETILDRVCRQLELWLTSFSTALLFFGVHKHTTHFTKVVESKELPLKERITNYSSLMPQRLLRNKPIKLTIR